MAANTSPIFVLSLNSKGEQWTHSDAAATVKDLLVAGASGSRCFSVAASSSDTSDVDFQVFLHDGSTAFLVGTVTVPAGSGNSGAVAAVNLLGSLALTPWLNPDGSVTLPTGWKLQAANVTQVTTAKTVSLVAIGADY